VFFAWQRRFIPDHTDHDCQEFDYSGPIITSPQIPTPCEQTIVSKFAIPQTYSSWSIVDSRHDRLPYEQDQSLVIVHELKQF
jgi:hypothetical protein